MTYFNQNPFALKKDAIDSVMTWLFTSLALIGLVIQVFKEIFGGEIADRLHRPKIYLLFFLVGLVAMVWAVWLLSSCGKWIAKRNWFPEMIKIHREMFESSLFIVEHGGWREEQLPTKDTV
jgi:hypothetical protein